MSESRRRIATLLAADVSDYSRPQASSEPQAAEALDIRREIVQHLIAEHGGRYLSTVGNSRIAEFSNAVDAVHCAVAIQQAMLGENEPLRQDKRVLLRIGLNVGDVTEENGNLSGHGVDRKTGNQFASFRRRSFYRS